MASGTTHANIAKITAHASAVGLLFPESPEKAAISFGMLIGILVTPDLDHHVKTREEARLLDFNKRLGQAWMLYTKPYSKLFSHRGVSHWLIIGTLTRLPWIFPPLTIIWFLLFKTTGVDTQELFSYVLIGWTIQDTIHIVTDKIYSWLKAKKKGRRKRPLKKHQH